MRTGTRIEQICSFAGLSSFSLFINIDLTPVSLFKDHPSFQVYNEPNFKVNVKVRVRDRVTVTVESASSNFELQHAGKLGVF